MGRPDRHARAVQRRFFGEIIRARVRWLHARGFGHCVCSYVFKLSDFAELIGKLQKEFWRNVFSGLRGWRGLGGLTLRAGCGVGRDFEGGVAGVGRGRVEGGVREAGTKGTREHKGGF